MPDRSGVAVFPACARFAIRFRRPVLLVALVVAPLMAVFGGGVFSDLKPGGFDDPMSESFRTDGALLADRLGVDADLIALYTVHSGTIEDGLLSLTMRPVLQRATFDSSVVRVVDYFDIKTPLLISDDGKSTFVVIAMRGNDQAKIAAVRRLEPLLRVPDLDVKFGGISPAFQALNDAAESDLRRAELLTLPLTAALLFVVFGSVVSAAVPLTLGGLTIVSALSVLRLVARGTDISIFAASIVTVLGLGLAVDYSLFILNRYREELPGRGAEGALTYAMSTTGRAVAFSGLTLAASLCGLFLFPQNFLRSMALGGIIVALGTVFLSLTVLPALIAALGPRLDRLRLPRVHADTALGHHNFGFWRVVALWVMRQAVPVAVVVTALLLVLTAPFLHLRGSIPDARVLGAGNQVRQVHDVLEREFYPHETTPHELLLTYTGRLRSEQELADLNAYQHRILALPGVGQVNSLFSVLPDREPNDLSPFLPDSIYWQSELFNTAAALFQQGTAMRLDVVSTADIDAPVTQEQVRLLRSLPPPPGTKLLVGGRAARLTDLKQVLRRRAPLAWLFLMGVMCIVLFLVFGSVTLPLKAMVMNLLSIGASFGAIVSIFQDGRLQGVFRYTSVHTVDATQPILMFAIVFGLSMDYEVLLLSRIREEYVRSGDNALAVARGLQHTGRLITSAAALLVVVIGAFATSDLIFLKQLGVGIALAIALDATVVRALLVPATMKLMGRWNWWAPAPLTRLWQRVGLGDIEGPGE